MTDSLIIAPAPPLPPIQLNPELAQAKEAALQASALIGKVVDRDSKIIAVRAQQELKSVISKIEKSRVALKEPLLIAGRKLDAFCAAEAKPVDDELGRVSQLVGEFDEQERQRVLEEQRLQREELARIERDKQAELDRIAREQREREAEARRVQEEIDRKAREAQAEVNRLAAEATNKKQRAAAEAARIEAENQRIAANAEHERAQAALREQQAAAAAQAAAIEEKAGDAAYCAAKPVEITKVAGQRQSSDWNIVIEQPFVLAKYHPDLVDIKPRLGDIKQRLNAGMEVKGIKAERKFTSGVVIPKDKKAIEV